MNEVWGSSLIAPNRDVSLALIDQDRNLLELGEKWISKLEPLTERTASVRLFPRKIVWDQPWLPRSAPKFHLWLSSFFLNESPLPPESLAQVLLSQWKDHLEPESLIVMVEPALRDTSRKLLKLREALLQEFSARGMSDYQVLLPCLGHQACGALKVEDDWCHERITWWRPEILKRLDLKTGLDHKTLDFSYLVIARSQRSRPELLPKLGVGPHARVISPVRDRSPDYEFFLCQNSGKSRARLSQGALLKKSIHSETLDRGSIFIAPQIRGDSQSQRLEKFESLISAESEEQP
jgi:hypothetical protein